MCQSGPVWSAQQRAVMALLRRHQDDGLDIEDVELAAEQFIAMVSQVPGRMAHFGVCRTPGVEENDTSSTP